MYKTIDLLLNIDREKYGIFSSVPKFKTTLKSQTKEIGGLDLSCKNSDTDTGEVIKLDYPSNETALKYNMQTGVKQTSNEEVCKNERRQYDHFEANSNMDEDESVDENTQIADSTHFEIDGEFGDCYNSPLPFLNMPRTTYKSMLDFNLECYLQGMFSN